ncbi:MAG: carboxypeptidase regulatory-like domain-containing protein, partial [Chitinophagaceae bacterium]
MKKIFSKNWLLSTAMLLCLASCQKEFSSGNTNPGETPVDLNSKVRSSVSGFVTDENNDPVQSAMVKVGVQTVSTDEYGYFEVADVEVTKNAATVTVTKAGFFPGIRTYMASNNKAAAVRIKLLAKSHVGTISAVNGGEVTLTNGLKVSLPANGVILAAGGTAYTGTVNVAAKWINPTAADLARIMPGDLRAIDADNNMKLLVTYGMAAVELTSGSGEKLQVAPGKKAKLTLPLPASI